MTVAFIHQYLALNVFGTFARGQWETFAAILKAVQKGD